MKLSRPLVILDLETTGTWVDKDKIIEIAMVRREPGEAEQVYDKRINPQMPIPPVVTEVTGIRDEDVREAPPFRDIAGEVLTFLDGADLGGFNLERFDLPLLAREMTEAGLKLEWEKSTVYDAQKIFHLNEKRDLSAAYEFYCRKELKDAHSALADTRATLDVLEAQVGKYGSGNEAIEVLGGFEYKKHKEFYDAGRKFRWWNGELYMMFGKYARRYTLREVAARDKPYLEWILSQNFSDEVKDLVEGALDGKFPAYETDNIQMM